MTAQWLSQRRPTGEAEMRAKMQQQAWADGLFGSISEEDKIKETFDLFDRDGDGKISTKEVGTVLRALGLTPTEGEVANIIKDISEEAINFDFF